MTAAGDKDVRGLDVPMHDSLGVGGIESIGDLDGEREKTICVDGLAANVALQSHAIQEFHGDERLPVLLSDVVNGADVRVVQCGSGLRLSLEAVEGLRIARDLIGQEFQSDEPTQPSVLGLVDDTHSPTAQPFNDTVVGHGSANHVVEQWYAWCKYKSMKTRELAVPRRIGGVRSPLQLTDCDFANPAQDYGSLVQSPMPQHG